MQTNYPIKVQVIRSRKQSPRFYVNIPLPLAVALDLDPGEAVQWQLINRAELRLLRLAPVPARLRKRHPRK